MVMVLYILEIGTKTQKLCKNNALNWILMIYFSKSMIKQIIRKLSICVALASPRPCTVTCVNNRLPIGFNRVFTGRSLVESQLNDRYSLCWFWHWFYCECADSGHVSFFFNLHWTTFTVEQKSHHCITDIMVISCNIMVLSYISHLYIPYPSLDQQSSTHQHPQTSEV